MENRITVVLADANEEFRTALQQTLENAEGFDVVGSAADGLAAAQLVQEKRPQLLVMDLLLPGLDGFGVLRYLRSRPPLRNLRVLAIADDPSLGGRALELGADDVILRPIDPEQVRRQLG